MNETQVGRRSMIGGVGVALAGFAAGAATACAQAPEAGGPGFSPDRHEQDAWMDMLAGGHRIFIDSATPAGGAEALLFANNLYNAQSEAYAGGNGDLALVVCFRHLSTPFGYNDEVWAKYGEAFNGLMQFPDPATGQAPSVNLMNSPSLTSLPNMGNTIDALIGRGAQFAICNAATQFISGQIAAGTGASAEDVYQELVAGAIPNSRFVPAGVMAVTRSQEYGYSLLYSG